MSLTVSTSSLRVVSQTHTLRCDAKTADALSLSILDTVRKSGCFQLGDVLPTPFVKGVQPTYLDQVTDDAAAVVNTLSVQKLRIVNESLRFISREDFEALNAERRLRVNDVLLTVDGGVSIGKPVLFSLEGDFTIDSHVAILRPSGISSAGLVALLASPLGQLQFRRAESGASGQTTVTEEDIRRFIFPCSVLTCLDAQASLIEKERERIQLERDKLDASEAQLWASLPGLSVSKDATNQ